MPLAALCMSHSPLLEAGDPPAEVVDELELVFERARSFVRDFDPEVIISFAPDHYNGFFYDLMPQFCIGYEARGIGDFGGSTADFDVPRELARLLGAATVEAGVETAISLDMRVDHGAVQPLEILFGAVDAVPVVPIFINSVATPFTPMRRVRELGEAIGRVVRDRPERILLLGSGGLSHDPPVPLLDTANEQQLEHITRGRNMTPEARQARQQRVVEAARMFAGGEPTNIQELNPEWDRAFMALCRTGDVSAFDVLNAEQMTREAGHSSHEVRTWVAALSALRQSGTYRVVDDYYRPLKELIAGFGVMSVLVDDRLPTSI